MLPYHDYTPIYCFDHPWILHYHVFNHHHIEQGVPDEIGKHPRRTLQESSFISEDFTLIEYADRVRFKLFMIQHNNLVLWNKKAARSKAKSAKKEADLPTTRQLKPFLAAADRRLPVGLREGTGAVYVYSYGNRTVDKFKDMFDEPQPGVNDFKSPQMDIARDAPSHINKKYLLNPFLGDVSVIKKNYDGCDSIVDLRNTDHIDAHIFTLKYVAAVGGLGLFTGTSSTSSDGKYQLFTPNQLITRFYGRRHTDEGSRNSYTQEAIHYRRDGSKEPHGLFTPEADEYLRLAHFLNHDAVNPSCAMVTNSDGYIDVVVHPLYEMQWHDETITLEDYGGGLPPGTELTFDYGKHYEYGEGWARVPEGKTQRDADPPTDDEEVEEEEDALEEEEEEDEGGDTELEEDDDDDEGGDTELEEEEEEEQQQQPSRIFRNEPGAGEFLMETVWENLIDEFDGIDMSSLR